MLKRLKSEQLIGWGIEILLAHGMKEMDARLVAESLVDADLRNIYSHGMAGGSGIDDIILRIKNGCINPDYQLKKTNQWSRKYPAILHIDADGGPGHSTAREAVRIVKELALKYGIGKIYVNNANHFGVAGIYSEMIAAEKKLIGKVSCITPLWMKPFAIDTNSNEQKKALGTNPIAWSTPYGEGIITIDMATSQRAASVALKAAKFNQEIEEGQEKETVMSDYLVDSSNTEVLTPPDLAFVSKECSLWPLGGKHFGYKGFGLSLSIELDHIVGGCWITDIPAGCKTIDGRIGHIFEAVTIESQYPAKDVLRSISAKIDHLRRAGGQKMKLPGQIEHEYKIEYLKKGIPYSETQIYRLKSISEIVGVPFDLC